MIFLVLTLICLIIQGFFSMQEMACVSFNRVRLQYYAYKGNRRARYLSRLLHHPTTLFGTTLIGVNAAMQLGSEFARRFYLSIGYTKVKLMECNNTWVYNWFITEELSYLNNSHNLTGLTSHGHRWGGNCFFVAS